MGDNQKSVKVTVEATGNEFTLATGELIAKTRDVLLDQRRSDIAATTWAALSENDQRSELERYTEFAEELVRGIVEVVAAGNFDVIHAKLDNFKSKDGEVTVTAKGRSSDGALLALNRIGVKLLKIVVADDGQFDQHRDPVPIDADQPDLLDGESGDGQGSDDDGDVLDPETGELKSADDTTQAVIDAVEDDLTEEEKAAKHDERLKNAHAFGRGSYDEHQDSDQNPYFEDKDDDLRNAWFNGFYERLHEVKGDDAESSDDADEAVDEAGSEGDDEQNLEESSDGPSADYTAGLEHRKNDGSRDENPHDGGTDEHMDWQAGFDIADQQIAELFKAGQSAAEDGKTEADSPWKKKSFEHQRWMIGFERWHNQNKSDE